MERILFFSGPFLPHPFPRRGLPPPTSPPYTIRYVKSAVRRGGISRPDLVEGERAVVSSHLTRLPIRLRFARYAPMAIPPSTVKVWPVMYNAVSSVAMYLHSRISARARYHTKTGQLAW